MLLLFLIFFSPYGFSIVCYALHILSEGQNRDQDDDTSIWINQSDTNMLHRCITWIKLCRDTLQTLRKYETILGKAEPRSKLVRLMGLDRYGSGRNRFRYIIQADIFSYTDIQDDPK